MATYTPEQFKDAVDRFAQGLPTQYLKGLLVAVQQIRGELPQRVFNHAEDKEGNPIGKYSTKPMLVGAKSFPTASDANRLFGSKSKRAKLDWVTYKGHKLAVLDGGYKELRDISGRRTDTVDLNMVGDLQRSIKMIKTAQNEYEMRIFGSKQVTKARANEERFKGATNTIFAPSDEEKANAQEAFKAHMTDYIKKFFN